jgi:hypothetical protein
MRSPAIQTSRFKVGLARLCIGLVFFFNVECAILFLVSPQFYAPSFELAGAAGEGMLRGMGILFLMWNVPYAVALWKPVHFKVSLIEAMVMQVIGAAGETLLLVTLPGFHPVLRASVTRFIVFDAGGVVLLAAAWLILFLKGSNKKHPR